MPSFTVKLVDTKSSRVIPLGQYRQPYSTDVKDYVEKRFRGTYKTLQTRSWVTRITNEKTGEVEDFPTGGIS